MIYCAYLTGCTNHPGDQLYCSQHRGMVSPAVDMKKLSEENRAKLQKNRVRHNKEVDLHEDQIYIIEGNTNQ